MDISSLKRQVFDHMLATRPEKYRSYLSALKAFKYVAFSPSKGDFLESYYAAMRHIDDVVDGDAPLPDGVMSAEDYVQRRIDFSSSLRAPSDIADYLLLHASEKAKSFGQDFRQETEDILYSMLFDARRRGKKSIFSAEELNHHFHLLDIRGTISATLKVFGEDAGNYKILEPLGLASRIFYNLRDYGEDIEAGFVNIPNEDIKRLQIEDPQDRISDGVRIWFRQESLRGLELLASHRTNMWGSDFGMVSRITLQFVYENPARKYFQKTLHE